MKPPVEPTPEEIRQRCREIQATWTEVERQRRIVEPNGHFEIGKLECDERHRWVDVV